MKSIVLLVVVILVKFITIINMLILLRKNLFIEKMDISSLENMFAHYHKVVEYLYLCENFLMH
jgi:hypothetical protein